MVKCLTHGLRGFNGAVQRRLATLTVTMLISSCWQLSSEVELRRIFDVCKRWANSGSHEFVKKNMVRYMRPHGRFAHCSCKHGALTLDLGLSASAACMLHFYTCSAPTARFGLLYRNIIFCEKKKFRAINVRAFRIVWNVEKCDFLLASRCVCVCARVCVSNFQRFKPLQLINGLRYRYEIWYNIEAITTL